MSCCVAAAVVAPTSADAQAADWALGASVSGGLFVGDQTDFLDAGLGVDLTASRRVNPHLQLRADGLFVFLDEQSAPGETAGNRIVALGVGPELAGSLGPVSAYGRGLLGVAANQQVRSGSAVDEITSWATALGAGVGLRVRPGTSVSLDLGGDVVRLGELDFARTSRAVPENPQDTYLLRLRLGLRVDLG